MISLLPPDAKKQLRAARINVVLRNYYMLVLAASVLLAGVFGAGLYVTDLQKANADADKNAAQQQGIAYSATSQAAGTFRKNLAVDKTILASDVRFSKLITDIAALVPPCVILNNLTLSATNLNAPLAITGRSCTYNDAVTLKNSLEKSPLFENVKLVNAVVSAASGVNSDQTAQKYPIQLNVSAQFSKTQTNTGGTAK